MSTTTQKPNTSPSVPTNHKVEPAKAPEPTTTVTVETPKAEAAVDTAKTIISISVEPKLARQARLLARFRGCSISSLFTDAAAREIPAALKSALADLKEEVE